MQKVLCPKVLVRKKKLPYGKIFLTQFTTLLLCITNSLHNNKFNFFYRRIFCLLTPLEITGNLVQIYQEDTYLQSRKNFLIEFIEFAIGQHITFPYKMSK